MSDFLQDITDITSSLDDYLKVKERNRDYIETSSLYGAGGKGNVGTYKEFKYIDEEGNERTQVFTYGEAKEYFGTEGRITKKDDPLGELKSFNYVDKKTNEVNTLFYSEEGLDSYISKNPDKDFTINDVNTILNDMVESGLGVGTGKGAAGKDIGIGSGNPGIYDAGEIDETKQNLFNMYKTLDKGKEQPIDRKPISNQEAQFVIDINNIISDYADTRDDAILGKANIVQDLKEINSIYEIYLDDIADGEIDPSKIKHLKKQMNRIEEKRTTIRKKKAEGTTKGGKVYAGIETPPEETHVEYMDKTYGKNRVMYFNPETKEYKTSVAHASDIEGSPLFGWTPVGNVTGATTENLLKMAAKIDGKGAWDINDVKLGERDKKQLARYEKYITHAMDVGTVPMKIGTETKYIHLGVIFGMNDSDFKDYMADLGVTEQKYVQNAMSFIENYDKAKELFPEFRLFKNLHKEWGWYYDPTIEKGSDEFNKLEERYPGLKLKSPSEYISPTLFDPVLMDKKSDASDKNPLGLDIPEDLFR